MSKSTFKPLTAYKRSIEFDGKQVLRCKNCGISHIMACPSKPSEPRAEYHWTQAFNAELGNFFCSHERCV